MATSDYFETARDVIVSALDQALVGKLDSFSSIAYTLGKYGISIYVLWYAYTVAVGKQKSPIQDFIWNLFRFWLILIFVRNMEGWLDSANQAIDGLKTTFSGGDPWKWLDQLWSKVLEVAKYLMSKDTSKYIKIDGSIAALLTYAGGILAMLLTSIVYLAAEITLKVLSVTAPLFIICLLFGFLRQMFNSWLQLMFSSCFIFLFGGLAIKAGMTFLNGVLSISIANVDEFNLISTGAQAGVAGLFMAWISWQAKTYASQLAGVSVEGTLQGIAAMGIGAGVFGASRMARGNPAMGKNTDIGMWKSVLRQNGEPGQSPEMSGKLGNFTGQGLNIGAKKLRSAAIEMARKKYGG